MVLKVLYVHTHGAFGGASRSLYEVIRAFPAGEVEPVFISPRGNVQGFFSQLGEVIETLGVSQFDNTQYSHYRGLRWFVLLREICYLPSTLFAMLRARAHWKQINLVHVNEITGLLPWLLARWWFNVPVIVHVRSVARTDRSLRTRWINRMLRKNVDAVIAIDETVRRSLPTDLPIEVIHNAFSVESINASDLAFERKLAFRPESFKVGFVGNLLRVKGIHDLIEAARLTRDRGLDVEFIIVGAEAGSSRQLSARILNRLGIGQNVGAEVEKLIDLYGLRDRIHMVGFTESVALAYRHMHVLCFPSHFDAPGRPIFEAAFLKVPSIVAIRYPTADTLVDGETGIAIPLRDPEALTEAITRLANDRALTARMGQAAYRMAIGNFTAATNALKLLDVYKRVTGPIQ